MSAGYRLRPALLLTALLALAAGPASTAPVPAPAELNPKAEAGLLLDIAAAGSRMVAVGERGNILISDDGRAWTQVLAPARSTLTAVYFADARHGWAVGHDALILATTDGGRSWRVQHYQPEPDKALLDVLFLDAKRGYAVGSFGLLLVTSDGGSHWTELEAAAIRDDGQHLNSIARLADGSLMIAGEAGLLGHSQDGLSWQRLPSPYEGSFFGVVRRGARGALAFGLRGSAYLSDDPRTQPWRKLDLGSTRSVFGGQWQADGSVLLVGADGLLLRVGDDERVEPLKAGSATLSSVLALPGRRIAVGEQGVLDTGVD